MRPGYVERRKLTEFWVIICLKAAPTVELVSEAQSVARTAVDGSIKMEPSGNEQWMHEHEAFCKVASEQGACWHKPIT